MSSRLWLYAPLLAACTFSVDPVELQVQDAGLDMPVGNVDDLTPVPDLTAPADAPDLGCSTTCTGVTCGMVNACGTPCCAPSGCTPVACGTCQVANSCGNLCETAPNNSTCPLDMGAGFCNAGVCSPTALEFTLLGNEMAGSSVIVGMPLELGVQFSSDIAGQVVRLRFYQQAPTGPHTGHLWDAGGTLLATASFTTDNVIGWHEIALPSPVPIAAGTTYVASYSTTQGFPHTSNYFDNAKNSPPLHAPVGAGIFANAVDTFPTMRFQNSNYWIDVVVR